MEDKFVEYGWKERLKFAEFPNNINFSWKYIKKQIDDGKLNLTDKDKLTSILDFPVFIQGPPGCGKTTLACGLGYQKLLRGLRVKYLPLGLYFRMLSLSEDDREVTFKLDHWLNDIEVIIWDNVDSGVYTGREKTLFYRDLKHRIEYKNYGDIIISNMDRDDTVVTTFGTDLKDVLYREPVIRLELIIEEGHRE